jgi:hypothetical protein
VIAALMKMAEPPIACQPVAISALIPGAQPTREKKSAQTNRSFASFFINWGQQNGATTPRLLSHICRRGDIQSRDVGVIRIGPSSSTFEVISSLSTAFERQVAKPDTRDPELRITRDKRARPESQSASPASRRADSARRPASRPPWKKGAKATERKKTGPEQVRRPSRPRKKNSPSP